MVTMTLIQGVLNTFVIFIARLVGYLVDPLCEMTMKKTTDPGLAYFITHVINFAEFGFCDCPWDLSTSAVSLRMPGAASLVLQTKWSLRWSAWNKVKIQIICLKKVQHSEFQAAKTSLLALFLLIRPGWSDKRTEKIKWFSNQHQKRASCLFGPFKIRWAEQISRTSINNLKVINA